ncbi:hypothetical protein [Sphingobacterium sp.]|uniref:hypothetical protein n=1 Tax=Sphingobacterium sp. TaxID=341027 RepID=UPI0028AF17F1|nr:hypothetical protein [Sphingobacterium sp.]
MAKVYLEVTLTIDGMDRAGATAVYILYKDPFLQIIKGALSKELLTHIEDVQVLHGFDCVENAQEYLLSDFFNKSVVPSLQPYLKGTPNIRIYSVT